MYESCYPTCTLLKIDDNLGKVTLDGCTISVDKSDPTEVEYQLKLIDGINVQSITITARVCSTRKEIRFPSFRDPFISGRIGDGIQKSSTYMYIKDFKLCPVYKAGFMDRGEWVSQSPDFGGLTVNLKTA